MSLGAIGFGGARRTERDVFVPSWTPGFTDLSCEVTKNGKPLGFRIEEVAEERRWAIQPSGECMGQLEFEAALQRWYRENYEIRALLAGKPRPVPDVMFDAVPRVEDFVAYKVDPRDPTKLLDIRFDPEKTTAPKPQPTDLLYTADGESAKTRAAVMREQEERRLDSDRAAKMAELGELYATGEITEQTYISRSRALFQGPPVQTPSPLQAHAAPEEAPEEPTLERVLAKCGAAVKPRGKHLHELRCKTCQAMGG